LIEDATHKGGTGIDIGTTAVNEKVNGVGNKDTILKRDSEYIRNQSSVRSTTRNAVIEKRQA
jgi:hypothetical protein